MSDHALEWVKKVPSKPGIYLRNNPPSGHVIKEYLFLIEGKLCMGGNGLSAVRIANWHGAASMLWYGPIPKIPEELKS